jgi:putative tryptophan/tyrosine transport system substrate-binding protein
MTVTIGRRELLAALGGAAAWPLPARAQQPDRVRRIGILAHLPSDDADAQSRNAAFLQGLQELGWAVGRNVRIDYRWSASNFDPERMRKGAVELVALSPDVVLATTVPIVLALQQVSRTVPIVFAGAIDPVGPGLVASRGRAATPPALLCSSTVSAPSGWSCSKRSRRA